MSTVEDVARELGVPTTAVLAACRSLDIIASSGSSGLSAEEHRRLRSELHAPADLPPVVAGSTERSPGDAPRRAAPPGRARRRGPAIRTITRLAVYGFLAIAVAAAVVTLRDRDDGEGTQALTSADEGTCVDFATRGSSRLTPVDCADPHDAELFEAFDLAARPDAPYPGQDGVVAEAERRCGARFGPYVGREYADSTLDVAFLVPTARTWGRGDRTVLCLVEDPSAPLVGSVAGADR